MGLLHNVMLAIKQRHDDHSRPINTFSGNLFFDIHVAFQRRPTPLAPRIPQYQRLVHISMAGKCMEQLIRDAIMTHMTENDLLSPKQHGFIQGRSCVTQLVAVLDS